MNQQESKINIIINRINLVISVMLAIITLLKSFTELAGLIQKICALSQENDEKHIEE